MVRQGKQPGVKEPIEFKQFRKDMEEVGFDVAKGSIKYEKDELVGGLSFEARVDIVRFFKHFDPNDDKYPRTKENFKKGLFTMEVIRTSDEYFNEYTMDMRVEDTLDDKKEEEYNVTDLAEDIIEGGDEVDSIAVVSKIVLERAREEAKKLYTKVK